MVKKKKIFVITGQTATGKTVKALSLANEFNGELVNADSRQVYKKLDIVTGKDLHMLSNVKIWLYDIVDPKDRFSSFDYVKSATSCIENIINRGKTPIIVGGSYFYLKHLLYSYDVQVKPDEKLRTELNEVSTADLQEILRNENPSVFEKLNQSDRSNPHRLIRKIEITRGESDKKVKINVPAIFDIYDVRMLGFKFKDNEILENTITKRVKRRVDDGALNEVKTLLNEGYSADHPGLQTIGYKQIILHIHNIISYDEMLAFWISKEIQYAKRQLTFMKKDANIVWEE